MFYIPPIKSSSTHSTLFKSIINDTKVRAKWTYAASKKETMQVIPRKYLENTYNLNAIETTQYK